MNTDKITPSAVTETQPDYDSAVIKGKHEILKHTGESVLAFACDIVKPGMVRITSISYGLFTIIPYTH